MFKKLIVVLFILGTCTFSYAEVGVVSKGGTIKTSSGVIIEDTVPSLVVTGVDHWITHVGGTYTASDTILIGAGVSYKFLFKNITSSGTHMHNFSFTSSQADASIEFYEGSTVEANGTSITPRNNNRNYSDIAEIQVFKNASTSALGTQLEHDIIVGSKQIGGSGGSVDEWILKEDTLYIIVYINNSGSTDTVSYHFDFLETNLLP